MIKKRICADCGEELNGRADKKFCSDQCRNNFNNRLNSDNNSLIRNINNILKRNRRILSELAPSGKATLHRDRLSDKGFRFGYSTHSYVTRKGATYYFCYDFGYLRLPGDFITIVQRESASKTDTAVAAEAETSAVA
ncbi:MAG TPA: hypothetical protein VFU15_09775 [Bacteroidia bacterium]|nr:hypothetical protein [Bacteroidia bacterium]